MFGLTNHIEDVRLHMEQWSSTWLNGFFENIYILFIDLSLSIFFCFFVVVVGRKLIIIFLQLLKHVVITYLKEGNQMTISVEVRSV